MPFADFHVHGNFKTFFSGYKVKDKVNPWMHVSIWIDKILFLKSNRIFSSQSCFKQLDDGDMKLGVIPLYSAERGFVNSTKFKILNCLSKKIDDQLFKDISSNEITYWKQLKDCYDHLLTASGEAPPNNKVNFTRCSENFKKDHMNIVLSMEGAHCFLDHDEDTVTPAGMEKIVDRMNLYKQREGDNPRVFILNLTHLTRAPFSNHCFGIKILTRKEFIPQGKGISPAGLKVIDASLSFDKDHYPIIIDIKHMSLESRKEFYAIRREKHNSVPVIASHAGCTGISWDDISDYIEEINSPVFNKKACNLVSYVKPRGTVPQTEFNPWSINLYDEDIVEILSSGGVIGLSLDQRILGSGKVAREKMSRAETFPGIRLDRPLLGKDPGEGKLIKDAELHFRHFCNTLFRIVDVGNRINPRVDAWKQMVIGSDFDGFIDAVDFCINANEYKNIKEWMEKFLPDIAEEAKFQLPQNLPNAIDDLMFNNAENFLKKYYSQTSF